MPQFELSEKQELAYDFLSGHPEISELMFGGGASGGKTFLGSFWIASECVAKPGSAWLIAREELKALKRTTMRTFFKVLSILGYKKDVHYNFNAQDMVLTFANKSVVFFAELKRIPSDPEFDRMGSYDLTGAWIDEAQEVCKDAKDALQFRFRVLEGYKWITSPKTLYTCNPSKGWIYNDFWKPLIKEGKEIDGRYFITSLYTDNPYIDHEKYRKNVMRTGNKVKIERLLKGNFDYDDDPNKIFEYDKILDLFTNKALNREGRFLSVDVAAIIDRLVIGIWEGFQLKKVIVKRGQTLDVTENMILDLAAKYGVPHSNIIIDADGMGIGVVHHIRNCKGFHNGAKPIQPTIAKYDETKTFNYANLKTQCYMLLAEKVNNGEVGIDEISLEDKEALIEELDVIKQTNIDSDKKIQIEKKEDVKEVLGRSPDIADMMMMRMFFELKPAPVFFAASLN